MKKQIVDAGLDVPRKGILDDVRKATTKEIGTRFCYDNAQGETREFKLALFVFHQDAYEEKNKVDKEIEIRIKIDSLQSKASSIGT